MKTKLVAAAVLALSAIGSASAMTAQYGEAALVVMPAVTTSTLTRMDVRADYLQARQQGAVAVSNEAAFAETADTTTRLTRSEVRAQAAMSAMTDGRSTF